MTQKSNNRKTGDPGGCGAFPARKPTGKQVAYIAARTAHPEWSKAKCKAAAGYADGVKSDKIEGTQGYQDLSQRIRSAQTSSGFNVQSSLNRLSRVIKRKGSEHDKDAIAAIRVGTEITGEKMPELINVSTLTDDEILSRLTS